MRPRALYYRVLGYQKENLSRLRELFEVEEFEDPREDREDVLERVKVLFAPLGFALDGSRMDRCSALKAIVSNTTGVPHIDVAAATRRGIAVCALHNEPAFLDRITPTAEHAIGLMLAAHRQLIPSSASATAGSWNRRPWSAPKMLSRMRLGIVGYGRLGRKVAEISRAMDMDVAWFDPYVEGSMCTIIDLARRSDVLSLHATATPETRHLVSRQVLDALPPGAVVVNTARGELLDLDALLDRLEAGHVRAAALDTLDGEYQPGFLSRLAESRVVQYARTHDNLILTPHIGGSTVDAWLETERFVIEKAARVLGLVAQT